MEQTRLAGTQNPAEVQSVCELVGAHSVGMEQAVSEIKTSPICGNTAVLYYLIDEYGKTERCGVIYYMWHSTKDFYDTKCVRREVLA